VISGSWDGSVRLWDMRARERLTANLRQPERVYTMDVIQNKLVVGTAGRHIWIWDLRRMKEPEQRRESSLKYQTRCLRAFPDGTGFAVSSIEGRVAMEYFDPSPDAQAKKYPITFLTDFQRDDSQTYTLTAKHLFSDTPSNVTEQRLPRESIKHIQSTRSHSTQFSERSRRVEATA
jgi:WD40 repeat protein